MSRQLDLAIAHWSGHFDGGGERVAWELARSLDAPLYVGYRDPAIEPEDIDATGLFNDDRKLAWLIRRGKLGRIIAYQLGWQVARPLRDHDVILTSGIEPLYYVAPPEQPWIAYTHHTHRQSTDQFADQVNRSFRSRIKQILYTAMRAGLNHNLHKPDAWVANSDVVARRMHRYWGIPMDDITVVYPPVRVGDYGADQAPTGDYYLTLSRLDPIKRIDEIVRAFDDLDAELKVAGDGGERKRLERLAGDNVDLLGRVSEARKRELLAGGRAFVFAAADEDFGLVDVEAMASGTPVIGVREGMTHYKIRDGLNGVLFERGVENLRTAICQFETDGVEWDDAEIEADAERFGAERFAREISAVIHQTVERVDRQVEPEWHRKRRQRHPAITHADGGGLDDR